MYNTCILQGHLRRKDKFEGQTALDLLKVRLGKRGAARARPLSASGWSKIGQTEDRQVMRKPFFAFATAVRPETMSLAIPDGIIINKPRLQFCPDRSKKGTDIICSLPCSCVWGAKGKVCKQSRFLRTKCNTGEYKLLVDKPIQRQSLKKYKLAPYSFRRTMATSFATTMKESGAKYAGNVESQALKAQMGWKAHSPGLFNIYSQNKKKATLPKLMISFVQSLTNGEKFRLAAAAKRKALLKQARDMEIIRKQSLMRKAPPQSRPNASRIRGPLGLVAG